MMMRMMTMMMATNQLPFFAVSNLIVFYNNYLLYIIPYDA